MALTKDQAILQAFDDGADSFRVQFTPLDYEYKIEVYDTSALYAAGLVTEVGAGWEPMLYGPGDRSLAPGRSVVTYRRPV